MASNKNEEVEIRVIENFNEMKEVIGHQSMLFSEYLTTYNVKVFNRTITRVEDF